MTLWTPVVFIRYLFFLIAGILLGMYLPDLVPMELALVFLLIVPPLFLLLFLLHLHKGLLVGLIAQGTLILTGYLCVEVRTTSDHKDNFMHEQDTIRYYQAVITTFPEERAHTWRITAEVTLTNTSHGWKSSSGKVMLYLNKHDLKAPFHYGDVLLITGSPVPVNPPQNPYEFDYARLLSFSNICHQHFLHYEDIRLLGNNPRNNFIAIAMRARTWAADVIKKYVTGKQEQAIAVALVLGVKEGIDQELLQAYAASGTMHVLAVSGLHVGIIYWIVLIIFRPLKKIRAGKYIIVLLSLIILWGYAFITGLSPSVLRAAAMFSFVALAGPWRQSVSIYNVLAASAFFLLLYDPYLIMSVGFQLSYLAVVGIVYLYPKIYALWEPGNWLMNKLWQTTAVSLAAQVAVFVPGLFYFHQFPVYFLLSNLFAVPGSSLVLILGVVLLVVSFIDPIAQVTGLVLAYAVKMLNAVVIITETLPYSVISNVYISMVQCAILMVLIVTVLLLFRQRKFVYVPLLFVLAALFGSLQWHHTLCEIQHDRFIVYSIPKHRALDLIERNTAYFFADSVLKQDQQAQNYHISTGRLACGITNVYEGNEQPFVRKLKGGRLMLWKGLTILHIMEKDFRLTSPTPIDYVIVSNNAVWDLCSLQDKLSFNQVILDSSNSKRRADKLLQQAASLKINFYSVLHQGAFNVVI